MTRGKHEKHQAQKKKHAQLAAAFPQGIRCQKCYKYGHWSYECTNKGMKPEQTSRTPTRKSDSKSTKTGGCSNGSCPIRKKQKKKSACKDCSDCSSNESNSSCASSSDDFTEDSSQSESDSESSSGSGSSSCSGSDCP